ncbi:MAG: deoxyguanosinetriphosphate triphosphohydrolase [Acidiferrobacteraceae bacterium]
MNLAAYAVSRSRGRRFTEDAPAYRSEFQRDRDRIIHSSAFRRLEYKTQVFVNHEGDLFRTRLTHSIEVAQIARSIARALGLNEDLAEGVALAHDLGHTPFGHSGQDALNACMSDYGGFEHNLQSLRVVDLLEERYAAFPGLNLTFEAREGILKHCSRKKAAELGDVGERFLHHTQPSLEAQLVNLADEIAYNNHDVDDGLRSGLIEFDEIRATALFAEQSAAAETAYPGLPERRLVHETVRRMINALVVDVIDHSRSLILAAGVRDVDDVRAAEGALFQYSPAMAEKSLELKRFLRERLYAHFRVRRMSLKAANVVRRLFEAFMGDARLLAPQYQQAIQSGGGDEAAQARVVADYIAGMTDRFAIEEYRRLFEPEEIT